MISDKNFDLPDEIFKDDKEVSSTLDLYPLCKVINEFSIMFFLSLHYCAQGCCLA
jgi:hypothetical protein